MILFGDVDPSSLGQSVMQNISEFVSEQGRGVVFLSGPRYTPLAYAGTPLASLIPVDLSRAETPPPDSPLSQPYVVRLTRLGEAASFLQLADRAEDNLSRWQNLPGLYWLLHAPQVKPGARVLAEHPQLTNDEGQGLPVICLQYVGPGKVVFHATDETWRWRLEQGDQLFGRYWLQTILFLSRWQLSQRRPAELTTDRQRYVRGEPVRMQLRYFDDRQAPEADDAVSVILQQQGQAGLRVALRRDSVQRGIFQAALAGLAPGRYAARIVAPTWQGDPPRCEFRVEAPDHEWTETQANLAGLRQAADQSGGRFYTFDSAGQLLGDLPAGGQVRVEPLAPRPVWNSWMAASLLVGLLLTEWLLRRRAGL